MRMIEIMLDNPATDAIPSLYMITCVQNSIKVTGQENAFALRKPVWLHNVSLLLRFYTIVVVVRKLIS